MIRDVPRPPATCPECGEQDDLFWHCALQDGHGVYDWGTLVTCNKCKILFNCSSAKVEMCAHEAFGVIMEHAACHPCPSQSESEERAKWFIAAIEYHRRHPKLPGEEGYEFWRAYQTP